VLLSSNCCSKIRLTCSLPLSARTFITRLQNVNIYAMTYKNIIFDLGNVIVRLDESAHHAGLRTTGLVSLTMSAITQKHSNCFRHGIGTHQQRGVLHSLPSYGT
jgi:hypothetical protein